MLTFANENKQFYSKSFKTIIIMRLNKKISALIVMLFLGAMATQVIAQPSIPRRYSTTKSKKKTRTSSSSTVWGTQYDWLGQR